jgi:hypothetical protein
VQPNKYEDGINEDSEMSEVDVVSYSEGELVEQKKKRRKLMVTLHEELFATRETGIYCWK